MDIYLTSTIRSSTEATATGAVARVDLETGKCLAQRGTTPLPFCGRNDNPRGGTRGWRGLLRASRDELVACHYDGFVHLSPDLEDVDKIVTHPLLANLHGMTQDDEGTMWAANTRTDSVAEYTPSGGLRIRSVYDWPGVAAALDEAVAPWSIAHRRLDPRRDYREVWEDDLLHLNYVVRTSTGRLVALLAKIDCVLQLEPGVKVLHLRSADITGTVMRDGAALDGREGLSAPHDLVEWRPDELLVSSSAGRALYSLDCRTGTLEFVWRSERVDRAWHRGLAVSDDVAYIGTGVGSIVTVDLVGRRERDEVVVLPSLAPGVEHSIFSIVLA